VFVTSNTGTCNVVIKLLVDQSIQGANGGINLILYIRSDLNI
jgi:hypothetical protein